MAFGCGKVWEEGIGVRALGGLDMKMDGVALAYDELFRMGLSVSRGCCG